MKTGYYRYKISDLPVGTHNFNWYINGQIAGVSTVIIREFCNNYKYLKYLDNNGIYRMFSFNNKWEQVDTPTLIGKTNRIITSLKNSQANTLNIGYKNKRTINIVAENVNTDELLKLTDIFTSPRVYLNLGTETKEDWVLVTLTGDGIGRRRKNEFGKFIATIELPEHYSITSF